MASLSNSLKGMIVLNAELKSMNNKSSNAEKIDCEKNSFEVDSLYLPKL